MMPKPTKPITKINFESDVFADMPADERDELIAFLQDPETVKTIVALHKGRLEDGFGAFTVGRDADGKLMVTGVDTPTPEEVTRAVRKHTKGEA